MARAEQEKAHDDVPAGFSSTPIENGPRSGSKIDGSSTNDLAGVCLTNYGTTYSVMPDELLLSLAAERDTLAPEAREALRVELEKRKLDQQPICSPTAPSQGYASMSRRFLAYLADVAVVFLIVFSAIFVSALLGKPIPSSESTAVLCLPLFLYMTVAEVAYHTTVGKYAMGLEVCLAESESTYPPFWERILLRETLGRIVSLGFWGVGYWLAINHPRNQAWSDRMTDTVVRVRSTRASLRKALVAFIGTAVFIDGGLIVWGLHMKERHQQYQAIDAEMKSAVAEASQARKAANEVLARQPAGLDDWRSNMRELLTDLDRYDRCIDRLETLLQRSKAITSSASERRQLGVLLQVWELRKQQSQTERREADLVLRYDPNANDLARLQSQIDQLESDVASLNRQASQMLSDAGLK